MGQFLEGQGFTIDGTKGKNQLYALYSEARHRFTEATNAVIDFTDPRQMEAGIQIFSAVLNTIKYSAVANRLPTFDKVKFDGSVNDAIFPPPIFSALRYFESLPAVNLVAFSFKRLHSFDDATLAYPHSVLRDQDALERFFVDLIKFFSGEDNPIPLLPGPNIRAYQICRYCDRALGQELEIIGEPLHAQIFLPRD